MGSVVSLFLFATSLLSSAAQAADSCTFENLCERFALGYQNAAGDQIRKKFPKKFDAKVFDKPTSRSRIERIFSETQKRLIEVVQNESVLSTEAKIAISARINAVKIEIRSSQPREFAYDARFLSDYFRFFADASIAEMPEANLVNLIAHELSHSFDEIAASYTIVRDGALVFENIEEANPSLGKREILSSPIDWNQMRPIVDKLSRLPIVGEQMNEAVPDYFARAVSVRYLLELASDRQKTAAFEGMMDILVKTCAQPKYIDYSATTYPSIRTRVEKIYFGDPTISKLAGCQLPTSNSNNSK